MPAVPLPFACAVEVLKAVAEPTRLRMLVLLARNDLTVTDLTEILDQSQPRVSRHLKLLLEAGLIDRHQEGAWAYFRLTEAKARARMVRQVLDAVQQDDPALLSDGTRLDTVRQRRAAQAADYFAKNAGSWDRIRSLHVPDAEVESALLDILGSRRVDALLDIGTGTGRMLELMAPLCGRALGVDASREMLAIARAKLDEAGITNASVRLADAYRLPVEAESFDLITVHQVLHHLDDPAAAIRQAARALRPGGRLVVVDFAPHELEFLRTDHAHLRLGFLPEVVADYLASAELDLLAVRTLDPKAEEEGHIAVTLWLAEKPRASAPSFLRTAEPATSH
ncbi:transcriptional regulator, ArsR family [Consotaella salsifontis]|uniref:Transcriptional regulator, ArsR family n=2 Tax=Consotaella salsifontis TaxID=1365950 RepID=A0A1T4MB25_9HYPH|nr:metalloregulator ArsR/SmtB family transcription factor [Consotaella salsifontis]SJZ64203.1 transcriptional regulator, ArsR family [Consotaella salsifontis]